MRCGHRKRKQTIHSVDWLMRDRRWSSSVSQMCMGLQKVFGAVRMRKVNCDLELKEGAMSTRDGSLDNTATT